MPLHEDKLDTPVEASFDSRDLVKVEFVGDEDAGVTKIVTHWRVPEKGADGGVSTRTQTIRASEDALQAVRDDDEATRILGAIVADALEQL